MAINPSSIKMPVSRPDVASRMQATAGLAVQQVGSQVAAAPGVSAARAAQQTAPQVVQAAGEEGLRAAQTGAELSQMQSQVARAEADTRLRERLAVEELKLQKKKIAARREVSKLGESVENDILTSELNFLRDRTGKAYLTERQLMDYKAQAVRTREEFNNWELQAQQMHDKKMKMMDVAYRKAGQQLDQDLRKALQEGDQATRRKILEIQMQHKAALARAAAKKAANASIGAGIGMIVGVAATAAAVVATGGLAAPLAPAILAAGGALTPTLGNLGQSIGQAN